MGGHFLLFAWLLTYPEVPEGFVIGYSVVRLTRCSSVAMSIYGCSNAMCTADMTLYYYYWGCISRCNNRSDNYRRQRQHPVVGLSRRCRAILRRNRDMLLGVGESVINAEWIAWKSTTIRTGAGEESADDETVGAEQSAAETVGEEQSAAERRAGLRHRGPTKASLYST